MILRALLLAFCASVVSCGDWYYGRDQPNRWSTGGVWPLPKSIVYDSTNTSISPKGIVVISTHTDCDIIKDNIDRYQKRWFFPFPVTAQTSFPDYAINILITEPCPTGVPQFESKEDYTLRVQGSQATLKATQVWGALRGLETFSQLIFYDEASNTYKIRSATITDSPRFPVRGIMYDPSRHFLSVETLKRQMDLMAQNKFNYLHWHLVDSESFTYESAKFPNLHAKGAYTRRHYYTRAQMQGIIDYARLRGIRVVPEFDTPGHTGAWVGQPGFLTDCFNSDGSSSPRNLLDPTVDSTYTFLQEFFNEVSQTFPDNWLHLGGDEVTGYVTQCWRRNPKIMNWMAANGMGTDTQKLETYYFNKLSAMMNKLPVKKDNIFWQEVFDRNSPAASSIIHLWDSHTFEELRTLIASATSKGHRVIVSSCWYLNYIKYGADWKVFVDGSEEIRSRYYYCDPTDFPGTDEQKAMVQGGIAAIFGEFIDNTNLEPILWPRVSAVAERLWSPAATTTDAEAAWPRLHELRCRLVARGYTVSPNNFPDYCPFEFPIKSEF